MREVGVLSEILKERAHITFVECPFGSSLKPYRCVFDRSRPALFKLTKIMSDPGHPNHGHQHGPGCGHTAIKHGGHIDYLHDGHLHHPVDTSGSTIVEEHALEISAQNPERCTPEHVCDGHEPGHHHGPSCGHEGVPHGDHVDYLVKGHLHHPHGDHCDDHGQVEIVPKA